MRLTKKIKGELNELFLFELEDRFAVEAVFYRGDTLCVSTQVGCRVGCRFCASGSKGLFRSLRADEIVKQVELVARERPVKRVAVAGIGEPLANWRSVKEAFFRLKERGLKVSFYTVGSPLKHLRELLSLPHAGVTVSLHALDKEKRRALLPGAGPPDGLIALLEDELPRLSAKKRKKVSLGYLLLRGVNDSEEELRRLATLAKRLGVGVTLLYYNRVGPFEPPTAEEYERAFLLLRSEGVRVTLSTRFRKDRLGGCGTLVVNRL
ncbi:MAG: radical SAM protein [Aquificae bacterium]|nr:radical SAM protein [Aquificota bacterium]